MREIIYENRNMFPSENQISLPTSMILNISLVFLRSPNLGIINPQVLNVIYIYIYIYISQSPQSDVLGCHQTKICEKRNWDLKKFSYIDACKQLLKMTLSAAKNPFPKEHDTEIYLCYFYNQYLHEYIYTDTSMTKSPIITI